MSKENIDYARGVTFELLQDLYPQGAFITEFGKDFTIFLESFIIAVCSEYTAPHSIQFRPSNSIQFCPSKNNNAQVYNISIPKLEEHAGELRTLLKQLCINDKTQQFSRENFATLATGKKWIDLTKPGADSYLSQVISIFEKAKVIMQIVTSRKQGQAEPGQPTTSKSNEILYRLTLPAGRERIKVPPSLDDHFL